MLKLTQYNRESQDNVFVSVQYVDKLDAGKDQCVAKAEGEVSAEAEED